MARPITWQNVNAPQITSGISQMMSQGNQSIQKGIQGFQDMGQEQRKLNIAAEDRVTKENTNTAMQQIMTSDNPQATLQICSKAVLSSK